MDDPTLVETASGSIEPRCEVVRDGGPILNRLALASASGAYGSQRYTFAANNNGRNASAALNGTTAGAYLYNAFVQRVQKWRSGQYFPSLCRA